MNKTEDESYVCSLLKARNSRRAEGLSWAKGLKPTRDCSCAPLENSTVAAKLDPVLGLYLTRQHVALILPDFFKGSQSSKFFFPENIVLYISDSMCIAKTFPKLEILAIKFVDLRYFFYLISKPHGYNKSFPVVNMLAYSKSHNLFLFDHTHAQLKEN